MLSVITIEKTSTNNNWLKVNLHLYRIYNKIMFQWLWILLTFTLNNSNHSFCFCGYKRPWKLKTPKTSQVFEANPRKFGDAKLFQNMVQENQVSSLRKFSPSKIMGTKPSGYLPTLRRVDRLSREGGNSVQTVLPPFWKGIYSPWKQILSL